MGAIDKLISDIICEMSNCKALSDIKFIPQYTGCAERPLKKTTVAIALNSVNINKASVNDHLDRNLPVPEAECCGTLAKVELQLIISAPAELGAPACQQAFSRIADFLLSSSHICLGIESLSCKGISYNRITEANELEAFVTIDVYTQKDNNKKYYTAPKDTDFWKISHSTGTPIQRLALLNPDILNPCFIPKGKKIRIR